jgi:hypothetical protein
VEVPDERLELIGHAGEQPGGLLGLDGAVAPATTAKPLPASPARAASMVALSASRLVGSAIEVIRLATSEISVEACPSRAIVVVVVSTTSTPVLATWPACADRRAVACRPASPTPASRASTTPKAASSLAQMDMSASSFAREAGGWPPRGGLFVTIWIGHPRRLLSGRRSGVDRARRSSRRGMPRPRGVAPHQGAC